MKYCQLNSMSVTDGPGIRVSLYVSGCTFKCKGCHNPEAWDFNFGKKFNNETKDELFQYLNKPYIRGISILGGEPLNSNNIQDVVKLVIQIRNTFPKKDIWIWTGFEYEELLKLSQKDKNYNIILNTVDTLVTGRFILEKRDVSKNNKWRGSTNQEIHELKK